MSNQDSDTGFSSEQLAGRALAAACQRDRPAVINLLAKYGASKLPELRLKDLQPFTRECEAIKAPAPSPYVYLSQVPFGHIVERYTNKVAYFVASTYDGTGYRSLTTLTGTPKLDVSQEELVLDLGPAQRPAPIAVEPPAPTAEPLTYHELWAIGNALDDYKTAHRDSWGESFATDGDKLIEQLYKHGFRVVRK